MLEKKGDLAASATVQSTEYTSSIAGDFAYAVDNKLFINANYQKFDNSSDNRARFFELGMGYYSKVGRFGFFESSLLYGNVKGIIELEPNQSMNFSMHAPSLSSIIGVKNKHLFGALGLKGGLLCRIHTSYFNISDNSTSPWYANDPGVQALEFMRHAAFIQFSATVGVKYKAISISIFNSFLAGPKAYGTSQNFAADKFAVGLRIQFNLSTFPCQGK